MFAVFEDGSHQYRVKSGDTLRVDFRESAKSGDSLRFERVLVAGTETGSQIGRPLIGGAVVQAEVLDAEVYGRKLEVGKFKRRKNYIRHNGHKQKYTSIRITGIDVPGLAPDAPAVQEAGA